MRQHYNLILMVVWLAITVVVFAPEGVVPEKLRQQFGGPLQIPVGMLAATLAVYNGVRWWSYRSRRRNLPATRTNPLAVRKIAAGEAGENEPNPAFDFSNPQPEPPGPPPRPSTNGDSHQAHPQ